MDGTADRTSAEPTSRGADSRARDTIPVTGSGEQGSEFDPLAGIPQPVRDVVGAYDSDTAGGCG